MADVSVAETLMPLARLKPLLALTKEPETRVPCAVGLDLDGDGVIMLARNGGPKKLCKDLYATVKAKSLKIKTDKQTISFGYASTDTGSESILKLTLNRQPTSAQKLAAKLLKRVRTAGFEEVVFNVEENLDGEEDEEGATETSAGSTEPASATGDAEQHYKQRLAELTPNLMRALKEQIGDVGKIRAIIEFAREKAAAGTFDSAVKALDALERLLNAPPPVPEGADNFSASRFGKLHDDWISSKQQVNSALAELHAEIIDEFDDPESTSAADNLARILARFNAGLTATLEQLRAAPDAGTRGQLAAKAARTADMYLAYLNVDPLIAHVEENPYEVDVAIKGTLMPALTAIREEVTKFAAV